MEEVIHNIKETTIKIISRATETISITIKVLTKKANIIATIIILKTILIQIPIIATVATLIINMKTIKIDRIIIAIKANMMVMQTSMKVVMHITGMITALTDKIVTTITIIATTTIMSIKNKITTIIIVTMVLLKITKTTQTKILIKILIKEDSHSNLKKSKHLFLFLFKKKNLDRILQQNQMEKKI